MKKLIGLGIAVALLFSLAACNLGSDFTSYKATKKAEIQNYATESNYCSDNWTIVCGFINTGKTAVDAAENKTGVDTAVKVAKEEIDKVEKMYTLLYNSRCCPIIEQSSLYCYGFLTSPIGNSEISITGVRSGFTPAGSLVIPAYINGRTVTQIGRSAFENQNLCTGLTIPSSVTYIGISAFYNCKNLSNINFEGNSQLQTIDHDAFWNCTALGSTNNVLNIPSSVTSIGEYAFSNCSSLKEVAFGNNSKLASIGYSAFYKRSNLRKFKGLYMIQIKKGMVLWTL